MKKLLITTVAFTALFSAAAYADEHDGTLAWRGTAGAYIATEKGGIPYIMPFVSDRTYKRSRNFQPGPFRELGANDKVEWRR